MAGLFSKAQNFHHNMSCICCHDMCVRHLAYYAGTGKGIHHTIWNRINCREDMQGIKAYMVCWLPTQDLIQAISQDCADPRGRHVLNVMLRMKESIQHCQLEQIIPSEICTDVPWWPSIRCRRAPLWGHWGPAPIAAWHTPGLCRAALFCLDSAWT